MTSCISKIPYPTSQTHHLPIPVKKLLFRREGCMQESVTYVLLAGQLRGWWVWNQIQSQGICLEQILRGGSFYMYSCYYLTQDPPLRKSRGLRVCSLPHSWSHSFTCWIPESLPAVSSPVSTCSVVIYCWQNQTWFPPMCVLQSSEGALGRSEYRRSIFKGWEEEQLALRSTPQFKNIQEKEKQTNGVLGSHAGSRTARAGNRNGWE